MYQPGRCFYEGGMGTRGPSPPQTSYSGTRDNTRRRAYMPVTIVVTCGLVSPMQGCGRQFSAVGERVNPTVYLHRCTYLLLLLLFDPPVSLLLPAYRKGLFFTQNYYTLTLITVDSYYTKKTCQRFIDKIYKYFASFE